MNDTIKLAVVNHFKDVEKPSEGVYPIHYILSVLDVSTGETYDKEFQGTLTQCKSESIAPTVSISWTTVCAELLRSCGVVGEAAVVKLRDAITKSLDSSADLDEVLRQSGKSVAESADRIKKDIIAKLPKVQREGKTKIAQSEMKIGMIGITQRKEVVSE